MFCSVDFVWHFFLSFQFFLHFHLVKTFIYRNSIIPICQCIGILTSEIFVFKFVLIDNIICPFSQPCVNTLHLEKNFIFVNFRRLPCILDALCLKLYRYFVKCCIFIWITCTEPFCQYIYICLLSTLRSVHLCSMSIKGT